MVQPRLFAALLAAAAVTAVAAPSRAAAIQPFSEAAFHAAQAQGRSILVDAHADWCPICHLQAPTLAKLANEPAFSKLVILRLNYDRQIAEKQALGIRMQSTLIAFKGSKETGRSVGVTSASQVTALAQTALN
ncbi:MAG TPA: thioredoxin family protein [Caulobacteraceae bacterium]|nr:thioredoxin family protein [Caulobacteraceae bacterium]